MDKRQVGDSVGCLSWEGPQGPGPIHWVCPSGPQGCLAEAPLPPAPFPAPGAAAAGCACFCPLPEARRGSRVLCVPCPGEPGTQAAPEPHLGASAVKPGKRHYPTSSECRAHEKVAGRGRRGEERLASTPRTGGGTQKRAEEAGRDTCMLSTISRSLPAQEATRSCLDSHSRPILRGWDPVDA